MASHFKQYHDALSNAQLIVDSRFTFERVGRAYFESRKFNRGTTFVDPSTGANRHRGRLSIEAKCMPLQSRYALAGETLAWECDVSPPEPEIEQVKVMHKGSVGCLEGNVFCRIAQPYRNISQG